jgi:hypothetical protein
LAAHEAATPSLATPDLAPSVTAAVHLDAAPSVTLHEPVVTPVAPQTGLPAEASVAAPDLAPEAAPDAFAALGLASELLAAVRDLGFTTPTTVQLKTIPLAMRMDGGEQSYNDLMVSSQTGSGKTAAFLLPVLHTLLQQHQAQARAQSEEWEQKVAQAQARGEEPPKRPKRKNPTHPSNFKAATPGALVLCPTRELAQQVAHDAIDLVRHSPGLRIANVVGGIRVTETSSDLAIIIGIVSRFRDKIIPHDAFFFGEIGLSGEIRPVANGQARLNDAAKHGFKKAVIPKANTPKNAIPGLTIYGVTTLMEMLDILFEI